MIAGIFKTGQKDLDELIIVPPHALQQRIYTQTQAGIEQKLLIKVHTDNLRIIKKLLQEIKDNRFKEIDYVGNNIIDMEHTQNLQSGLNTIDATFLVINLVCLIVLIGTLTQLLESKRKMLALVRISGLGQAETWSFLFMLSLSTVMLPYLLALPLSLLVSLIHPFIFQEALAYTIDWMALWNLLGEVLMFAVIATVLLQYLYFSNSLVNELESNARYG